MDPTLTHGLMAIGPQWKEVLYYCDSIAIPELRYVFVVFTSCEGMFAAGYPAVTVSAIGAWWCWWR